MAIKNSLGKIFTSGKIYLKNRKDKNKLFKGMGQKEVKQLIENIDLLADFLINPETLLQIQG